MLTLLCASPPWWHGPDSIQILLEHDENQHTVGVPPEKSWELLPRDYLAAWRSKALLPSLVPAKQPHPSPAACSPGHLVYVPGSASPGAPDPPHLSFPAGSSACWSWYPTPGVDLKSPFSSEPTDILNRLYVGTKFERHMRIYPEKSLSCPQQPLPNSLPGQEHGGVWAAWPWN